MTELTVGPGTHGDTNVESSAILSEAQQSTASSTDIGFSPAGDPLMEAALKYAAHGLGVFPLQWGTKHPFGGTNGVKDATTDPERIRQMWSRFPNAGIGMALSDELGAVDIDQKKDKDGEATLAALTARHGDLPETVEQRTPTGGRHLLFHTPRPIRCTADAPGRPSPLGNGIDTRGEGGYIVVEPSRHPNGGTYRWAPGRAPGETPFAEMPGWMSELVAKDAKRRSPQERSTEPDPNTQFPSAANTQQGQGGGWREAQPGEIHQPGVRVRMDQTTGKTYVYEPPPKGEEAMREDEARHARGEQSPRQEPAIDTNDAGGVAGAPAEQVESSVARRLLLDSFPPAYAEKALREEIELVRTTRPGGQANQLNRSAFNLGQLAEQGLLDRATVRRALRDAALQWENDPSREPWRLQQIEAIIDCGLKGAIGKPRLYNPLLNLTKPEDPRGGPSWTAQSLIGATLVAEPFTRFDPAAMGKRQWVLGRRYIRKFNTVMIAPGGVGKSTLTLEDGIAVVTGKPITGDDVHQTGKVWVFNNEDPKDELYRRIAAICQHWGVTMADLEGRLFVNSGMDRRLIVAAPGDRHGTYIETPHASALEQEIRDKGIDLLIVDPFVRAHQLNENDNVQIDFVAGLFSAIAARTGCSIVLVHHTRKPAQGSSEGHAGEADSARGASSLIAAARVAVTLSSMSPNDARTYGIRDEERWQYCRLDAAKGNMAPLADGAMWFKRESVTLPNGPLALGGDEVGVLMPVTLTPAEALPILPDLANAILDAISTAWAEGNPYTEKDSSRGRKLLDAMKAAPFHMPHAQAKALIREWASRGVIVSEYCGGRKKVRGYRVDRSKLPAQCHGREPLF
jgi:hypothetical protein